MKTKIALITGGSRGLGRNTALHLAHAGYDIILTYNSNKEEADKAVEEIGQLDRKAVALRLDISKAKTFKDFAALVRVALKETFAKDKFDVLINNAGIGINAPFSETTEEQFDQLVNIHLKGTFFMTQTMLPLLNDGGRIVNISTGLARFTLPGYSAYAAMKGGIEVLTRYMAKELGARQISVNTIAPGAIETDFGGAVVRDNKEVNKHIASATALGRVGLPDDIGAAITALVTEPSGWINAQRIEVSGGMFV